MPALIIFFCVCLWISKRMGWIVNPFDRAYMLPHLHANEHEPDRPMMWDIYTRGGVQEVGQGSWAQMKVLIISVRD